ncbi:hypothetical protein PanWU01x14_339190, partial [Parasponia andersonii]
RRRAQNLTCPLASGRVSGGLIYHRRLSFSSGEPFTPLFQSLLFSATENPMFSKLFLMQCTEETITHALFHCLFSSSCSEESPWSQLVSKYRKLHHEELLLRVFADLSRDDFEVDNRNHPISKKPLGSSKWECLPAGKLKLNVDATINLRTNCIGVGGVLRDSNGVQVDVLSEQLWLTQSPYAA